jgi:hypothetical protein
VSYVPPEVDEGWRGQIISKSGIPLAGRKIKRYIGVRYDALWRAFSCAKHIREVRSNSQQNLADGRLWSSFVAIQRTPPSDGGGRNRIDVDVAGQPFEPKSRRLSSLLWNKLRKL